MSVSASRLLCACFPVRWSFQTEEYDIGFVVCQLDSSGQSEVVPYSRHESSVACVEGETKPLGIGKCEYASANRLNCK